MVITIIKMLVTMPIIIIGFLRVCRRVIGSVDVFDAEREYRNNFEIFDVDYAEYAIRVVHCY